MNPSQEPSFEVHDRGDKPYLMLLHGVMSSRAQWMDNVEALKAVCNPVVVDVRKTWEYARGHVPGARLISLGELARRAEELDPAAPVAVICATGGRSQSAAALLGQRGFNTVYNVIGGTTRWMQNGLPVERTPVR